MTFTLWCFQKPRNPQENKMASLRFDILDPDRQRIRHVNDVSSVIFSSLCWPTSFLVCWAASLVRFQKVGWKNKVKNNKKLLEIMSRSFTLNLPLQKRKKPKWLPKWIPCSISGSAIKIRTCPLFMSDSLHVSHWQCFFFFFFFSTRWSRTPTSLWLPSAAAAMISWWSRASRRSPESGRRV